MISNEGGGGGQAWGIRKKKIYLKKYKTKKKKTQKTPQEKTQIIIDVTNLIKAWFRNDHLTFVKACSQLPFSVQL